MNSKHKNIKFTFETEDTNNFSFLDVIFVFSCIPVSKSK